MEDAMDQVVPKGAEGAVNVHGLAALAAKLPKKWRSTV
jgi:hypothetical protein